MAVIAVFTTPDQIIAQMCKLRLPRMFYVEVVFDCDH